MSTRYLLDLPVLGRLLREPGGALAAQVVALAGTADPEGPGALCTSVLVSAELRADAFRLGNAAFSARVEAILEVLPVLALERDVERIHGALRARAECADRDSATLLLVAQVIATRCVLATREPQRYPLVEELTLLRLP